MPGVEKAEDVQSPVVCPSMTTANEDKKNNRANMTAAIGNQLENQKMEV
jgi:hypothetical protein